MKRFVLDTQIYVAALRTSDGKAALRSLNDQTPALWLSAVVAHELLAGAFGRRGVSREAALIRLFVDRGRVVSPSFAAWHRAGEAIAALHTRRRIDGGKVLKSFGNDLLIAASCAEEDVTLVTKNTRDFAMIAEEIPFRFIPPWS